MVFAAVVFCIGFSAISVGEAPAKQSAHAIKTQTEKTPNSAILSPIQTKSMTGKLKSFQVDKNSFSMSPNNVGLPIDIACKERTENCDVAKLTANVDIEAEVYYEQEKWWAVSVRGKQ